MFLCFGIAKRRWQFFGQPHCIHSYLSQPAQGRMASDSGGNVCNPDSTNWVDTSGYPCANYGLENLCTSDGNYGSGWNADWGLFEHYATYDGYNGFNCPECGCDDDDIARLQRSVDPTLDRIGLCTGDFPEAPVTSARV